MTSACTATDSRSSIGIDERDLLPLSVPPDHGIHLPVGNVSINRSVACAMRCGVPADNVVQIRPSGEVVGLATIRPRAVSYTATAPVVRDCLPGPASRAMISAWPTHDSNAAAYLAAAACVAPARYSSSA